MRPAAWLHDRQFDIAESLVRAVNQGEVDCHTLALLDRETARHPVAGGAK